MADQFGGVAVDEYGGVAVEEPSKEDALNYATQIPQQVTNTLTKSIRAGAEGSEMGREQIEAPRNLYQAAFESAALPPGALEGRERLVGGFPYSESLLPIPSFTPKEGEPGWKTVAKEVGNLALGVPRFITSPLGITTAPVAAVAPTLTAGAFAEDMLSNAAQQASELYKNRAVLSPTQMRSGVTQVLGQTALAALPAYHAATGKIELPSEEPRAGAQVPVTPERVTPGAPEPVETKLTPADLEPGLMVGDKPLTGGEDHGAIRNKALVAADTPEQVDTILAADKDDSKHVFVDKNNNVLTREQAADALGEKEPLQSSRLRELQKAVPATPEPAPGQLGGGAAELGEIKPESMGEAAPTHGIAQRVREAQVSTGALGPEAAQPGEGISAPDSVERGRELLTQGLSPEQAVFEFNKTKAITADSMAVVRAHAEKLWRVAVDADRQAPNSPEAEAAWEAYNKFTTEIKPMQTEWHRIGMAQQGEVSLDDGSFISMRQKFKEATGRDLDEGQKDKAHKLAKDNEGAEVATDKAQKTVKDEINKELKQADDYTPEELALLDKYRQKGADWPDEIQRLRKLWQALKPGTEKDLAKINYEREEAAFASVTKLIRDKATRDANIENRKRVEEQERKVAVAKIEEDRTQKALGAANERVKAAAVERAKVEREKGSTEQKQKLELAKIAEKREQAARDAAAKTVREAAARRAAAEAKLQANPDQRVWAKVREYMAAGVDDFNDMVAKVATDLGMTQAQVKRWISFKPRIKKAMDEAWLKQQRERTLKETARRWVDDQSLAAWKKYASKVPSAAFGAKVFGHGFVAMGTHAPLVPFIPKYQSAFARNAGKMYRMVVDPTYYESQVQELQRQPTFSMWKRAGLQVDPHGWEDYTNPILTTIFGPLASAGNRGYFALKLLRQDIADIDWNALPKTARIPQVAKAIADATNHITGVTKAVAPRGLHVGLFAPRLLASRFALAFGDPARAADTFLNWKNADIGDKYFAITQAKQKAWILGTYASLLALNQAVLSATGSKQNINFTNPLEGDWMKFKMAGKNVAWATPFLTLARMPARLWAIREGPKGRMRNIVYPEETTAKFAFEYARSQASPFAQPLLDLWLKSDWQGRPLPSSTQPVPSRLRKRGVQPYTWGEWATQSFTPIPFEEAQKEVWHAMGLGTSAQNAMSRASLLDSAIMGLTGSRIQDDWNVSRTTDTPSSR